MRGPEVSGAAIGAMSALRRETTQYTLSGITHVAILNEVDDGSPAVGRQPATHWREASGESHSEESGRICWPPVIISETVGSIRLILTNRKTGNLRAVQLLLDHTKIESTVRYLGVEVDAALDIAEHVEV